MVERRLLDDVMRGPDSKEGLPGGLVPKPALANALRHTMRLLEDTATAADLVSNALPRPVHLQEGTALSPW
ncbi:hypothetical protein [Streptomyces microflavus]|uniref:hypothetical protein n=1 Tax=Streptomyces microflavus TaxID=1919 RepID=UPI00381CFBF2